MNIAIGLGGDYRVSPIRKPIKQGDSQDLTGDEGAPTVVINEKLMTNVDEADMLRGTLGDLLQSLLSDRVFADTLPEMMAEKVPFFSQLQYTQVSPHGPSPTDQRLGSNDRRPPKNNSRRSTDQDVHLSDREHDRSFTFSSVEQDKQISHRQNGLLPISSTPSSMFEVEPKLSHEDHEHLKTDPNLISLLEDLIENTLWNILQEAYHTEFSLTARPRLIALPPKRQPSLLTRANLQKSDANPLPPPPLIMTESID